MNPAPARIDQPAQPARWNGERPFVIRQVLAAPRARVWKGAIGSGESSAASISTSLRTPIIKRRGRDWGTNSEALITRAP